VRHTPSILAVADHTGWAHVVSVSARERRPFVVTRRRIALIDRGLPTQPFEHDTMAMRPDEAQALVANVRKSIATNTDRALQRLVDGLSREHPVKSLTIRKPAMDRRASSRLRRWDCRAGAARGAPCDRVTAARTFVLARDVRSETSFRLFSRAVVLEGVARPASLGRFHTHQPRRMPPPAVGTLTTDADVVGINDA
jgi:hypothetical protein